jgi:hypothetical protein
MNLYANLVPQSDTDTVLNTVNQFSILGSFCILYALRTEAGKFEIHFKKFKIKISNPKDTARPFVFEDKRKKITICSQRLATRLVNSVADPGCLSRILIFIHPESQIQKKRDKIFVCPTIFCSHKYQQNYK